MAKKHLDLDRFRDERALITFRRKKIDDLRIQGFVIAHSPALVLFRQIRDFVDDGYLVVPRKDISSLKCTDTDRAQLGMLRADGLLDRIDFGYQPPLDSLTDFLRSLPPGELLILEDEYREKKPGFLLGRLTEVGDETASVLYLSGTWDWDDEPTEWKLEWVSSVQLESCYLNGYARELARRGDAAAPVPADAPTPALG